MVTGVLEIQEDHDGVCKGCVHGNNVKSPFLSNEIKEKGILDIIYSRNIQTNVIKLSKKVCIYVSFIDDYSCKTWIYFLKNKEEVFIKFKEFKSIVENQIEKIIKTLRSDIHGEYILE